MLTLQDFNSLIGGDSYVRCMGKKRIDSAIVSAEAADSHVFSGGQIGWWVKPGYIIVDVDEGKEQILAIVKKLKIKTLMAQTPKGLHMYFKTDVDFPQKVGMILPCGLKCDFRCAGKGYVILPYGSEDRKFNRCKTIAPLPFEFTPLINRRDSLLGLKEGDGRNSTLFAHLMSYKNHGANDAQIETMANIINTMIFSEPMNENELATIVGNTKKYDAQLVETNPYLIYNSKGTPSAINARAVCDYFVNQGNIFVIGDECYRYDDGIYREAGAHVRNLIKDMVIVDNLITQNRIMETYRLIVDDIRLHKKSGELNYNKNLICFKNGVWDISTQELLPHDSKYLQTIQIPHNVGEFKEFKDTKLYGFLQKTKLPDEDIDMLLKYMAYCLTLNYGLKTFIILCGQSNTGKSVLLRFIESLIGKQNTSALSMHELNMRFYPAQLYNKLLNACGDNNSMPLSSIDNLKKITGGDEIMHEKKGKEPFFFVPFCKLIFSFNQLPLQLEEKSNAFYKRMRILYMNNELFLNDDYVNDLVGSVEEVIPYLLTLLPVTEIPRTKRSNNMVESLRQDSDSIHAFLSKRCKFGEDEFVVKQSLYDQYVQFCIENGREAHKKHSFMRSMRSQGFIEARDPRTRESIWKGISFKTKNRR